MLIMAVLKEFLGIIRSTLNYLAISYYRVHTIYNMANIKRHSEMISKMGFPFVL